MYHWSEQIVHECYKQILQHHSMSNNIESESWEQLYGLSWVIMDEE